MRRLIRKAISIKADLREAAKKEIEFLRARRVDMKDLRSVCLTLGPYRNLTTLTAGIIALHPNCQALNHAGQRIFGDKKLNFLLNYTDKKFDTFVRYAIYASGRGREGPYGGSVTYSHAFGNQHKLTEMYKSAYGDQLMKDKIHCLFWKESMAVSTCIRDHSVDLNTILSRNNKLRFLMPIRNPLDCAVSNVKFFGDSEQLDEFFMLQNRQNVLIKVLEAILDELRSFLVWKKQYPEKFFYYFEHEFEKATLFSLADFLGVEPNEKWCENSLEAFDIKSRYQHSEDIVDLYNKFVEEKFAAFPEASAKLLQFTNNAYEHYPKIS